MIEIAIALGVIGFALVAIIGILPLGLNVQRDNRAETIVNQDATYWLEAIRSGAQGIEDLASYVDEIVVTDNAMVSRTFTFGPAGMMGAGQYHYGSNVVSLLTQPYLTNASIAYVRAISGAAGEKGSEVGFKYKMVVETISVTNVALSASFAAPPPTLYDVRLAFFWPVTRSVVPHEDPTKLPPKYRPPLLYRTLISRSVATNYLNNAIGDPEFYRFTP